MEIYIEPLIGIVCYKTKTSKMTIGTKPSSRTRRHNRC